MFSPALPIRVGMGAVVFHRQWYSCISTGLRRAFRVIAGESEVRWASVLLCLLYSLPLLPFVSGRGPSPNLTAWLHPF